MKKNIKYLALLVISIVFFNCDDESNNSENFDPTSGWVEFSTAATTTGQTVLSTSVDLDVNVPVYENGLEVSYRLEVVQGDYTQYVNSPSSGQVTADPSDYSRDLSIDLEFKNMDTNRDTETIFDIVLTTVNSNATIGLDETSIVSHRVTIPTYTPPVIPITMFVGEYVIEDVVATVGPPNGTENFQSGIVNISIDPLNLDRRVFNSGVLPAFNADIEEITILFALNSDEDVEVGLYNDVDPNLACSAAGPYYFTQASAAIVTVWDGSTDDSIIITYTEDPLGSCGGPFDASFMLTKN